MASCDPTCLVVAGAIGIRAWEFEAVISLRRSRLNLIRSSTPPSMVGRRKAADRRGVSPIVPHTRQLRGGCWVNAICCSTELRLLHRIGFPLGRRPPLTLAFTSLYTKRPSMNRYHNSSAFPLRSRPSSALSAVRVYRPAWSEPQSSRSGQTVNNQLRHQVGCHTGR